MSITENFDLELEFCCNKSYIPFDNSVFVIVHKEYNSIASDYLYLTQKSAEDVINNINIILYPHGFVDEKYKNNYYIVPLKNYVNNLHDESDKYNEMIKCL